MRNERYKTVGKKDAHLKCFRNLWNLLGFLAGSVVVVAGFAGSGVVVAGFAGSGGLAAGFAGSGGLAGFAGSAGTDRALR